MGNFWIVGTLCKKENKWKITGTEVVVARVK